jgi:hypothetical protein
VFCQVNSQLFPAGANVATEAAWLVFWLFCCVAATPFNNDPNVILIATCSHILVSSPGALPWLRNFVLANKMLHEIILAVAGVVAVSNLTRPILQLTVSFVLMSDPVCLALE